YNKVVCHDAAIDAFVALLNGCISAFPCELTGSAAWHAGIVFAPRQNHGASFHSLAHRAHMSKGRLMLDVDVCERPPARMRWTIPAALAAGFLLAAGPAGAQEPAA